jgi:hypothetical protein
MRAAAIRAERGAAAILCLALALLQPSAARAHGGRAANVRPVLDRLPAELAGMRVELHETIAPQIVLANPTGRVVEVLDPDGTAFLRVGPQGAYGNVAAPAWFQTYGPGAPVPASAGRGREPRWRRARSEPSYGWFDPRLDAGDVNVTHRVADGAKPAGVGRWVIPLRVDGRPVVLGGRFELVPPPRARWIARLTSPSEVAPGVRVTLLPGRAPGLLVESRSEDVLTVLGDGGEPFLRIGPQGVEANVRSPAWRRSGRAARARSAVVGAGGWQRVAAVPRFGWLDPRAAPEETAPPADAARVRPFRVPMLLGERALGVTGEVAWQALEQPTAAR